MTHLEQALSLEFPNNADAVMNSWRDYALSTNQRGSQIVNTLKHFRSDLRGARLLDIGSGYGGLCIAAALEGADATGVDVESRLVDIAGKNLLDFPALEKKVRFLEHDVSKDVSPFEPFDIICCDNVIEHADSPARLIAAISRLLSDSGFLYMTIPNAYSLGQVLADCHYQLFAMSLADRIDGKQYLWNSYTDKPYEVSDYHSWREYEGLFRKFRLKPQPINAWPEFQAAQSSLRNKMALISQRAAELEANPKVDGYLRRKLADRSRRHASELEADFAYAETLQDEQDRKQFQYEIVRDYEVELWYVVAHRRSVNS